MGELKTGTTIDAHIALHEGLFTAGGNIIYADAANSTAQLAKGTDGQVLVLVSGLPAWGDKIKPAIYSLVNAGTFTIDTDSYVMAILTAQGEALTIGAPSGTPENGQKLIIRIKDNGTARGITWNSIFRAIGVTLPTTTTISKTLYAICYYNTQDTKWDVIDIKEEA